MAEIVEITRTPTPVVTVTEQTVATVNIIARGPQGPGVSPQELYDTIFLLLDEMQNGIDGGAADTVYTLPGYNAGTASTTYTGQGISGGHA